MLILMLFLGLALGTLVEFAASAILKKRQPDEAIGSLVIEGLNTDEELYIFLEIYKDKQEKLKYGQDVKLHVRKATH